MIMRVSWRPMMLALLVVTAAVCGESSTSAAPINHGIDAPTPDVFYNYWTPPVPAAASPGFGAQLYVAPRPVPPRVGHTWYTYPPFLPHEFLYKHQRRYVRPAGATGLRTEVRAFYW
jgi:hypothetical protein